GPDICGSETKKVHVILNYKHKYHAIRRLSRWKVDGYTHLSTLIIRPDQTCGVKTDNEMVASGSLEDDFDFLPPRKMNDPRVRKPTEWDNRVQIDDPNDIKLEGKWKPREILNPNYRGAWPHPQVDNPNYSPDFCISSYENIGIIGLDIWQVGAGTIFDNFLIPEEFGDETWGETKV
ncbi:CALR protein, partial [Oreotrochilus melanogaster]|nr:CALR protein [Oreotrochilus melanogaster]